jgi:hypothetical protein
MAGDWIKLRTNLPGDPAVIAMARALREDPFTIVGRLHALWAWADQHTDDGELPYTVLADIDDVVKKRGFAEQMVRVGWLEHRGTDPGVIIPLWERHNGRSAKKRCLDSEAQRRKRETHTDINRTMSESHSDKKRREPDQRREEKSFTPIVPASGDEPSSDPSQETEPDAPAIADRNRALARAKALFRMRPGTPLDPAETRAWSKVAAIVTATPDADWLRLEKYYSADLPDKNNFRRRTLATLLNNWSGEHIAAAEYCGRIGWRPENAEKKEKGAPPEGEWRDVLQVLLEEKNPAVADIDPRAVRSWSQLPDAAQTAILLAIADAEKEAA